MTDSKDIQGRILVVDDEPSIGQLFDILLSQVGYDVTICSDGYEALNQIENGRFDLVITDMSMPEVTGMDVLKKAKEHSPETQVILITAFQDTETAVEAMKEGAYDYLLKPFKNDEIKVTIAQALENQRLVNENTALRTRLDHQKTVREIEGNSDVIKEVVRKIHQLADSQSSVLIRGESGTGKELAARMIHQASSRVDRPFVSVNCAAIPENLIESELFGYQKGAFTGANADKMGLFEAANQGTLFLDEVGELPMALQAKLLRVLAEKQLYRLGDTKPRSVQVRVLSATNRDLETECAEGQFRQDLYFRLKVIELKMPALRERMDDLTVLVERILEKIRIQEGGRGSVKLSDGALAKLKRYHFPGNIRELENVLEQAYVLRASDTIEADGLPILLSRAPEVPEGSQAGAFDRCLGGESLDTVLEAIEREAFERALDKTDGNKTQAAKLLGLSFRSFRYRLQRLMPDQNDET